MKNNTLSLRSYAAVGILAGVFAAPVVSADELFRPYVGVGAQVLKLKLDRAFGGPLFNKGVVPGSTVFAGVRVGEFAGVEMGYNYFSRKRDSILGAEDIFPGSGESVVALGNGITFINYKTRARIQDVNLVVTGYLPLGNFACALDKTELFAGLGLSKTSVKMQLQVTADSVGAVPNAPRQDFNQKKTIPIARIGLQQNITENINLGLFSELKRLKPFKMRDQGQDVELRLKNSVSYGLRLGYIF